MSIINRTQPPFKPITREEMYLAAMVGAGGGGNGVLEEIFKKTATGNPAHIEGIVAQPAKALTADIEPMQEGSGDPAPDNVRPINGWTGANIYVSPTTASADGTTRSIAFPTEAGTVYGGTLDVTTGILTVTMAGGKLGDYTITLAGSGTYAYVKYEGKAGGTTNVICEKLKTVNKSSAASLLSGEIKGRDESNYIFFRDDTCTTAGEYIEAYADAQIVYELEDPIIYKLTPTEVSLIAGTNNVWADTGSVAVTYLAK